MSEVSYDGKRFIVVRPSPDTPASKWLIIDTPLHGVHRYGRFVAQADTEHMANLTAGALNDRFGDDEENE